MNGLQLERPATSQRPDGVVPDPSGLSELLRALDLDSQREQANSIRNTQQSKEATRLGDDPEIRRNGPESHQAKILPNKARNGSVNGIESKDRNGYRPEERIANKSQMKPKETVDGNVPHKREIGRDTEGSNGLLRNSAAHTLATGSFNRDATDTSSPKANGTVDDEIRSTKADAPNPPSIPIPKPLQSLEATKETKAPDAPNPPSIPIPKPLQSLEATKETKAPDAPNPPSTLIPKPLQSLEATREAKAPDPQGPSPAHRANVLTTEDNGTHAATAISVDPQPSHQPLNVVSEAPTGSHFADAHEVTGEPMIEVSEMKKEPRMFWHSKNRILNGWISRAKDKIPTGKSRESLNVDFVELDGLKLVKGEYPSAKDYKNFTQSISDHLESLIRTITFYGQEAESSTIEELKMILDKTGKVMPCIVIACSSQRRADDIKKQLKADLKFFDLYGLPWEVICDRKRFGFLSLSVASNGELSAIGNRGYFATTLSKNMDRNVWDRYAAAPIFLFPEPIEGEPVDHASRWLASCTLGGFIEVANSIYGLTVAHPLVNAIAMNPARTRADREAMSLKVGNIIACVLSSVSANDNVANERQDPVQSNSDWALIELGEDFDRAQWEQSGTAAYSSLVQREKLDVSEDADLEPRKVVIQTGFNSNVKGKLSIARSRLQIGLSRFSVMCIELEENKPLSMY